MRKETNVLRYEFTKAELMEFAKELARETQNIAIAEEEKKVAVAQFGERITRLKAEAGRLSRSINNGYEMRLVDCEVVLQKSGTAQIVRLDTGELVRERPMTEEEKQLELPIDKSAKAAKA